jgi:hypothetical protein
LGNILCPDDQIVAQPAIAIAKTDQHPIQALVMGDRIDHVAGIHQPDGAVALPWTVSHIRAVSPTFTHSVRVWAGPPGVLVELRRRMASASHR